MGGPSLQKHFSLNTAQKTKLSPQKAKSLTQQGAKLLQAGNYPEAVNVFSKLYHCQPKNATINYYLGYAFHGQGEAASAEKHYQLALKEKPALMQARLNLANVYMLLEKHHDAEREFSKVLKLKPDTSAARYGLGMALGAQDKHSQAAQQFEKAQKLDGHSKDIRNNLITALIKSENYPQALGILEKSADLKGDKTLLGHYGMALLGIGRLDQSEKVFLELLEHEPNNQEAIYNLARLYQDQTQFEKSLDYFKRLEDKESDIKILSNMGAVLDSLGKFEEAESILQKALALNNQDVSVLNHLGNALTGGNKTQDAEEIYRRAIVLEKDSALSHNNLGFALAARGRTQEAVDEYTKAIEIKPDYGESYRNVVTVKRITDQADPLICQMIGQIENKDLSERDTIQFGFALGKALDDCGEYDKAFGYYRLANDLIAKSRPFNISSFEKHVDNIIEVYSGRFFESQRKFLGSDADMPIFVMGMSRSGTTLAEKIISSHPQVQGAGELGKLFEVIKNYEKQTKLEYPFSIKTPDPDLILKSAQDYIDYIGKYINDDRVKHVIDKMPYNFAHLGFIALALPNAKLIHCMRDPIDTCLSNYFQYFPRGITCLYDLGQLTGYYQQYQRLMAHWQKVLPIPMFNLKYERLIETQEPVIRELIEFLGLKWDDACLQSHKSKSSVRTASIWQVRQPIYKKSVQRWRHYEKHIAVLIDAFGEQVS